LHQKRRIIVTLEEQKNVMIGALWANSNWDDDKGTRKGAIEDLESRFNETVQTIVDAGRPGTEEPPEEEIDHDNPFFAAADRGIEKLETQFNSVRKFTPEPIEVDGLDQS
jgi:hypothetical protein